MNDREGVIDWSSVELNGMIEVIRISWRGCANTKVKARTDVRERKGKMMNATM